MSVNYNLSVRTNRLQQAENAMDAGVSGGVLRLLDGGGNVLSSLALPKPAGLAANGVLQFLGLSLVDPAAAASGTATGARIEDSNGTIVISGLTVGAPTALTDIVLSPSNVIAAGQTIAIQAATITGN